jgi:hypothetical protein
MILLVSFVVWLGVGFWVGKTAERKGRAPFWWVALALVIGLLAFIPLLIAGASEEGLRQKEREALDRQRQLSPVSPGQIKELAELKDAGLLTAEEFETKKTDLLGRL